MATIRGGDRFAAKIRQIASAVGRGGTVRVGFLEGATYPDGTSVPMVAAIQEFGAPRAKIPPRPYFRTMVATKKAEWPDAMSSLLRANGYDARLTLEQTGAAVDPILVDPATGRRVDGPGYSVVRTPMESHT